jgi:fatty acid desaturase
VYDGSDSPDAATPSRPVVHDIPVALKAQLRAADGTAYRDFRTTLSPRWWLIWLQLALGYGALAAILAGLAWLDPTGLAGIPAALLGALAIGYVIAYLNNFFHESAHYNLVPGRRANDVITNLLMSWLFGSSIALYRRVHFQHHRALGTTMDSENSYFDPLRVRYLAEGLVGLRAVRAMRRYRAVGEQASAAADDGERRLVWAALAAVVNLAIIGSLGLAGYWVSAAAWGLGVLAFFPFFVTLRQVLEHRDEHADPELDYTKVDHGATNRLFGDGPVANTLGSAGFNRHALHHWEPQVSCTRLRSLERYLAETELAPALEKRRTTYWQTFLRLLDR